MDLKKIKKMALSKLAGIEPDESDNSYVNPDKEYYDNLRKKKMGRVQGIMEKQKSGDYTREYSDDVMELEDKADKELGITPEQQEEIAMEHRRKKLRELGLPDGN